MSTPSARAERPAAPVVTVPVDASDIRNKESTYFWHGEHDAEVCRLYVKTRYPESAARVVSMINMHRLHERSTIICIARKKPSANEKFAIELGRRISVPVEPSTQLHEVVESQPITVKEFISGATEWEDGALNASALIDACAKGYSPNVCHYRMDDGKAILMGA